MPAISKVAVNRYRTHTNNDLTAQNTGETVRLSGWVHARRDHGKLIFIDLRDHWGITQLTFDSKESPAAWQIAETLRSEYVIRVTGVVEERPAAMVNTALATGYIEVMVRELEVLSEAEALPFEIAGDTLANEELRLKYRFLDLRRPALQHILRQRDAFISFLRQFMREHQFAEVQTPILANSSPEGARDYLVPSRLYPGKFYALPQAPQQFKQLLMVGGFERYFQIAPCFRDEDPRADRHPGEFYQLDFEMSFVEQEDVLALAETLMIQATEQFSTKKIVSTPFPRLSWRKAMEMYGSDKPDLRYDMSITPVSEIVQKSEFKVFTDALEKGGVVHALCAPGGATLSRADIDELTLLARQTGAGGLAYILWKDAITSPISKYLGGAVQEQILTAVAAKPGDAIFFGAGAWLSVSKTLGVIRQALAQKLELLDPEKAAWCFITDFPMYEWNEAENKLDFSHNPFSMPQGGLAALEQKDPLEILGYQYDLVLNGYEISSGAIRNHEPETLYKAFALAGYSEAEVDERFNALISAFKFGVPPHGGMAPGIDRLMMVLWNAESIRDMYAFPLNGKAQNIMMNAPSQVSEKQLKELHLKVTS